MGILNNPGNIVTQSLNSFLSPFNSGRAPDYQGADFVSFRIQEVDFPENYLELTGNQLPIGTVPLGGTQKVLSEYYPGNPEPAFQVLGGRERPIRIRGRLKAKKFPSTPPEGMGDLRAVPAAIMDRIEWFRRRGNLLKITLGEIERYCILEEANFELRTLADIEYDLSFTIQSIIKPENCKLTDPAVALPLAENDALIKAAANFEANRVNVPVDFPGTLYSQLNDLISGVASVLSAVTTFVDQTISVAEDAQKLTNRGLGLIRAARANISQFKRRVGALDAYANSQPGVGALGTWDEAKRTNQAKYVMEILQSTSRPTPTISDEMRAEASSKVSDYTSSAKTQSRAGASSNNMSIDQLLKRMEDQFRALSRTVPMNRHVVVQGQTLQQISMKYYKTADNWETIYKHNKLATTVLMPGKVLEIPKL